MDAEQLPQKKSATQLLREKLGSPQPGSLHHSVFNNNLESACDLISSGKDVNATNELGMTPLDVARELNQSEIYQLLKITGGVSGEESKYDPTGSYVNLASANLGSKALWASNEWFAAASNLLKTGRGVFHPETFTDAGQLYDGWETARHSAFRRGGKDTCIIQLGVPGVVRGFDIDTNHFTGNYAPEASVEGFNANGAEVTLEQLKDGVQWTEILPKKSLGPSAQHFFAAEKVERWTHLRFHIYPDGGVARFRAFGDVLPDWNAIENSEQVVDLASVLNGGKGVFVSDRFYSHPDNVIMPERGINMGDGWETKRSRDKDHKEWLIIRLGRVGRIEKLELDTNHFKGNYPWGVTVEGCLGEGGKWKPILDMTHLQGHAQQYFQGDQIKDAGLISHARITIYPDGGISRIRLWGKPIALRKLGKDLLANSLVTELPFVPLTEGAFHTFGTVSDSVFDSQEGLWLSNVKGNLYSKQLDGFSLPVRLEELQKNEEGTTFFPCGLKGEYVVVVALPSSRGDRPDLLNLSAFKAKGDQAVHIKEGVWSFVAPLGSKGVFLLLTGQKEGKKMDLKPNTIKLE